MCGRFATPKKLKKLAEELGLECPDLEPRYNAAPSQRLPVITSAAPQRVQLFRWGLIPSWARDPAVGHKMINARAETLTEKPAYRKPLAQQRCLVPADGFYEWKPGPWGKVPHFIRLKTEAPMMFAGLWDSWLDGEERPLHSFTVITVKPNALVAPIHDRMPAILPRDTWQPWLSPALSVTEALHLLQPYPAAEMEAFPVNDRVNSPAHEGPELLLPPERLF